MYFAHAQSVWARNHCTGVERLARATNSATNSGTRSRASTRTHDQTRTRTQTNQLKTNGGYLEVGWETQPQQYNHQLLTYLLNYLFIYLRTYLLRYLVNSGTIVSLLTY